jgi:hypothetical protein
MGAIDRTNVSLGHVPQAREARASLAASAASSEVKRNCLSEQDRAFTVLLRGPGEHVKGVSRPRGPCEGKGSARIVPSH